MAHTVTVPDTALAAKLREVLTTLRKWVLPLGVLRAQLLLCVLQRAEPTHASAACGTRECKCLLVGVHRETKLSVPLARRLRARGFQQVCDRLQSEMSSHPAGSSPGSFPAPPSAVALAAARDAGARAEALRFNFISCLILTAQNGFGRDVEPFLALCRETWEEEILFDAVKDLPHGALQRKDDDGELMFEEDEDGQRVLGADGWPIPVMDPFGRQRTRLMYAAQAGDVPRVRWLLARGAQLELKDWAGQTALWWAARNGRVETVRELLAGGAVVGAASIGRPALYDASRYGHLEVVRELLARGAAVDAGRSQNGHLEVVKELLARGAKVDAARVEDRVGPLYIASQLGHLEVVRELLARGAAVHATRYGGWTPLHIASDGGHLEVVRELLERNADPALLAMYGVTALSIATSKGHENIAQLLRDAAAE